MLGYVVPRQDAKPIMSDAIIIDVCLIIATMILRSGQDDKSDDDNPKPEPISAEVPVAFIANFAYCGLRSRIPLPGRDQVSPDPSRRCP